MAWARVVVPAVIVVVAGLLLVSGGSGSDPRTPPALPGMPAPFLGTAIVGSGGVTAAIDAYGDVVDLRAPGPAGEALIDNPADRQAAGTVAADTGIVPRVRIDGGPALPLWRAGAVSQRYLAGTNVVRTEARFEGARVTVTAAATEEVLALTMTTDAPGGADAIPSLGVRVDPESSCEREAGRTAIALVCSVGRRKPDAGRAIRAAATVDRAWLARARGLGPGAPAWASSMCERSLLVLRALSDRRSGAVVAGARDGWAYVWPRDAATAALALAAAGYRGEARRVTRFLLGLELDEAARFRGDGTPVPGRAAQGDAHGWIAAAAEASVLIGSARHADLALPPVHPVPWRDRADYREGEVGDFLANAIASGEPAAEIATRFGSARGLAREGGEGAGLDSAAAWAVRPFARPFLGSAVRRTLRRLVGDSTRFGIVPGEGWHGGEDPWSAPTAWSAWSLAALATETSPGDRRTRADRRAALRLIADLRRAATPAGALPERVDPQTGVARSTTPLAWSHAFAVLALRELWPAP